MKSSEVPIRTFLALEVPLPVREAVCRWIDGLRDSIRGVRWVSIEQMHLTLRFLGVIDAETLDRVKTAAAHSAVTIPALQLKVEEAGVFPHLRRPRVVWVGISGEIDGLKQLNQELERSLKGLKVHQERTVRDFHPHITLGRIRDSKKAVGVEKIILSGKDRHFGELPVTALTLFQSELTSAGARYTKLAEFNLGGK